MILEWLRRTMPTFNTQLEKFLFTAGDLGPLAKGAEDKPSPWPGLGVSDLA